MDFAQFIFFLLVFSFSVCTTSFHMDSVPSHSRNHQIPLRVTSQLILHLLIYASQCPVYLLSAFLGLPFHFYNIFLGSVMYLLKST